MKLLSLTLENYQGIRSFSMEPNGYDINILADNGLGKSTLGNSITWLLSGKPMEDVKNYSIKTKGPDGQDIHYIDHSVEGRFQLDDGKIITLKKVVSEDWRQKRGTNVKELAGNPTSCYIDGVPAKESEYTMRLTSICDLERMKMLMLPHYFAESVTWEIRRRLLLTIAGDISDSDVIAANNQLAEIMTFLLVPGTTDQYYTVDDYRKKASSQKNEINSEIKALPARIDEARRALSVVTPEDKVALAFDVGKLTREQYVKNAEVDKLKEGGNGIIREEINQALDELSEARRTFQKEADREAAAEQACVKSIHDEIYSLTCKKQDAENAAMQARNNADTMSRRRESLVKDFENTQKQYEAVQQQEFSGDDVCPTCGRMLPDDQIQAAKDKFNLNKSKRLEELSAEMEMIQSLGAKCHIEKINALHDQAKQSDTEVQQLREEIGKVEEQLNVRPGFVPFEETEEYRRLSRKVAALRESGSQCDDITAEKIKTLQAEVEAISKQVSAYMAASEKVKSNDKQQARIDELSAREKELMKEYERLEKGVYLCEEFIRCKVSMLDERINSRFKSVRFKLFEQQLNGGLKECCEVLVPSDSGDLVPFPISNNAARINAGLEIISTLADYWGISMPVIVDNAESITHLQEINAQVIRLVVSEADKALRVEVA